MNHQVLIAYNCVKYLRRSGFSHIKPSLYVKLKIFTILIVYHVVTIGMWGHVIYYVNKYRRGEETFSFEHIGDDATGILSSYLAFYFELVYSSRCHRIETLLRDVGNFEHHEQPDAFERIMNLSDKISKITMQLLYASMVGIWAFSLFQTCEDGVVDDCGLLITAYLPFDIFYTPARQIFGAIQTYGAFSSAIATASISTTVIFPILALTLQSKHLQVMLMKIPKMSTRMERKEQIKKCVLYHYRIISLTKECSEAGEPFYLSLVFLASMVISLTSYQLIAIKLKYVTVIHCGMYLLVTGVVCVFGEALITESENLFNTLYDSIPWDGDNETAKDLYLMMMMAARDLYIEAGKFGRIGHIRFMMMLKGTYSFLTLFLNV